MYSAINLTQLLERTCVCRLAVRRCRSFSSARLRSNHAYAEMDFMF